MTQSQRHLVRYILIATLLIEVTGCNESSPKWTPERERKLDEYTTPIDPSSATTLPQGKKRVIPPPRPAYQDKKHEEHSDKPGILGWFDLRGTRKRNLIIKAYADVCYLYNVLARTEPDQAREILAALPDNPTKQEIKNIQSQLEQALGSVKKTWKLYGVWKLDTGNIETAKNRLEKLNKENTHLFNELAVKGYALALAQIDLKLIQDKEKKDEEDLQTINTYEKVLNAIFATDTSWARLRPLRYSNEQNRLNIFKNKALYANDNKGFVRVEEDHEYGERWRQWSERDSLLAHQCNELYKEINTLANSSLTLNIEEKNNSLRSEGYYFTAIKRLENEQKQLKRDLEELYEETKKLSPQRSAS